MTSEDRKQEFWNEGVVTGNGDDFNQTLERAGRVVDYFELGELMVRDALNRNESCGGHFREEHQTETNEAERDDDNYTYVATWEYTGDDSVPNYHKEQLQFEYVPLVKRSYK